MSLDLHQALSQLHETAPVSPTPLDAGPLRSVVRRRRAVRTGAIGLGTAAAVIGLGVAAAALQGRPAPVPPATTSSASSSSAPAPTPSSTTPAPSSPSSMPTPTAAPVATPPATVVAVTGTGDLVVLDAGTGALVRTVLSGLDVGDPVKLGLTTDADHTVAYLSRLAPGPEGDWEVVRVWLADGSQTVLGSGIEPSLSPDGSMLAWAGWGPGEALHVLDVATGDVRVVADTVDNPERWVGAPAWSADSATLYVPVGWSEGTELVALDARTATSVSDGRRLGPPPNQDLTWSSVAVLADGTLAVAQAHVDTSQAEYFHDWSLLVVDPASGAVVSEVPDLAGDGIAALRATPGVPGLLALTGDLGQPGEPGFGYRLVHWAPGAGVAPVADDLLAVGR